MGVDVERLARRKRVPTPQANITRRCRGCNRLMRWWPTPGQHTWQRCAPHGDLCVDCPIEARRLPLVAQRARLRRDAIDIARQARDVRLKAIRERVDAWTAAGGPTTLGALYDLLQRLGYASADIARVVGRHGTTVIQTAERHRDRVARGLEAPLALP